MKDEPATPEAKLDYVYAWVRKQERSLRRRRIIGFIKWIIIIAPFVILLSAGWYGVTHWKEIIASIADRTASSISEKIDNRFDDTLSDLFSR